MLRAPCTDQSLACSLDVGDSKKNREHFGGARGGTGYYVEQTDRETMVLLYGLFNSLRDSIMALAGIPFAIAGGVLALFVTGLDFSISAAIGFVSLFGVSVMDGILMITYYNQLRQEGAAAEAAMSQAAQQRMRPMLMTALSACIGLLPAAISTGIGS